MSIHTNYFHHRLIANTSSLGVIVLIIALLGLPPAALGADALKGAVSVQAHTAGDPDRIGEANIPHAQAVFESYQQRVTHYDLKGLMALYAPNARLILEVHAPGQDATMKLTPRQLKAYVGDTVTSYQNTQAGLTFPMVNYVPEGNGVRVKYYLVNSNNAGAYVASSLKIAPNAKGQWKIVEDHAVVEDQDGTVSAQVSDIIHFKQVARIPSPQPAHVAGRHERQTGHREGRSHTAQTPTAPPKAIASSLSVSVSAPAPILQGHQPLPKLPDPTPSNVVPSKNPIIRLQAP